MVGQAERAFPNIIENQFAERKIQMKRIGWCLKHLLLLRVLRVNGYAAQKKYGADPAYRSEALVSPHR